MQFLETIDVTNWDRPLSKEDQIRAVESLENGKTLYFPNLAFHLNSNELEFLTPEALDPKAKNISYDWRYDKLAGAKLNDDLLKEMIRRYSIYSRSFLEKLIPHYTSKLIQGKTSFRPVEISGRKTSYKKDDTRLHIDSFPSNPTKGQRILRVFTNINPDGVPRIWRLGEPLKDVLTTFLPKASAPLPGFATLLKLLGITKDYRTPYDHYMLKVHDTMKGNDTYQKQVLQETIKFPPGSSWAVFTDQVSHAAMSGQHVLEQTFHLSPNDLKDPSTSPLKIMERLLKKTLI